MLPEVRIIKYATCICMNSVGKKLHLSRGGYYPGGGGGGVLQKKKLGRGVRPASQNPYPIYDQNLRFSLPYL